MEKRCKEKISIYPNNKWIGKRNQRHLKFGVIYGKHSEVFQMSGSQAR